MLPSVRMYVAATLHLLLYGAAVLRCSADQSDESLADENRSFYKAYPSRDDRLAALYPHLDELTPGTFMPLDATLAESGISVSVRTEVEQFLMGSTGDVCLRRARQRVSSEDSLSRVYRDADERAGEAQLAARGGYGRSKPGAPWAALDRYGRIWQYAAEECLKLAGASRSQQFKDALMLLLTAYYRGRGNSTDASNCPTLEPITCQRCSPYRTADGSCNNLLSPRNGIAGGPLRRLTRSVYEDGIGLPRTKSASGQPLPNARKISTTVIGRDSNLSSKHTHMLMQWGQFLDHDFSSSPMIAGELGIGLACCADDFKQSMGLTEEQAAALQLDLNSRYGCFIIPVPKDDPFYRNRSCLGFSRSSTVPALDCRLGERTPVNKLTSYIDGSMVYGSSQAEQNALRSFSAGRLKTLELRGRRSLPPQKSGQLCNKDSPANECFTAGDDRVNETPALLSMHVVLVREHNRVTGELFRLNPRWNDERLFQEARKIVVAQIQHITYSEFLPVLLGPSLNRLFGLDPQTLARYYSGYNSLVDASVRTEFSSVAYRMGHTLIRDTFSLEDARYRHIGSFRLQDHFLSPGIVYNSTLTESAVLRGLLRDPVENFDSRITTQVSDHLFETGGFPNTPLDLIALNIQRARDHGIVSYVRLRAALGMTVPKTFDDLKDTHDASVINNFKRVYTDVRDIDPFPGGVTERSLPGAVLGPMFGKIVAIQYALAKTGDRFYYENDCASAFGGGGSGQNGTSCSGQCLFTLAQLAQIKKASLSRMLCDNADIAVVQRNAFLIGPSYVQCRSLPSVKLDLWRSS